MWVLPAARRSSPHDPTRSTWSKQDVGVCHGLDLRGRSLSGRKRCFAARVGATMGMSGPKHTEVGGVPVVHRGDPHNSISSHVGLTRYDGMLAAVIESPKAQISALLDVLDLHLAGVEPSPVAWRCCSTTRAGGRGGLHTLRGVLAGKIDVHLRRYDGDGWVPLRDPAFDPSDWSAHYKDWPGHLRADVTVPALVTDLVHAVGLDELRAYPMLTSKGCWSLRLEGLEIGRVKARGEGLVSGSRVSTAMSVPNAPPGSRWSVN